MFINNINPILFRIGPFAVRYYGLIYVLGFVLGYFMLRYFIKKDKLKITEEQLDLYFIWLILGVIIGARLFEVIFYSPGYYFNNLPEIFMLWHGGLSFHGGLVGAALVTFFFCKKNKINFYDLADLLAIPAVLALFFGRIANFTNSEFYGKITTPQSVPWCVVFQKVDDICRHPSQIYEAIKNLFIFGFLLVYKHKKYNQKKYKKGTMFWLFVLLYGVLRFFITFLRVDPIVFIGLSIGQLLCLIMIITSSIFLWKIYKK